MVIYVVTEQSKQSTLLENTSKSSSLKTDTLWFGNNNRGQIYKFVNFGCYKQEHLKNLKHDQVKRNTYIIN